MTSNAVSDIHLGILGASGHLGGAIARLALQTRGFRLAKALTHGKSQHLHADIGLGVRLSADLLDRSFDLYIDASLPEGLAVHVQAALVTGRPIVIGCTPLNEEHRLLLHEAARSIPVFYAANFSIGMALLHVLARIASSVFSSDATVDLIETHHARKRDAPSGSALSLASVIETKPSIRSIREGDVAGIHELVFATQHEQIALCHRVHSREALAQGALLAARFLIDQKPGLYGMDDLLAQNRKLEIG